MGSRVILVNTVRTRVKEEDADFGLQKCTQDPHLLEGDTDVQILRR